MSLVALDCKDVSEATADAFGGVVMNGDEYVRCARCSFGGCDVRVQGCGCTLHGVSLSTGAQPNSSLTQILESFSFQS